MRILFFLLFPIFLSAQINRAYGVIEIGSFPTSSATGPKFAYRPVDSSFYRWVSGNTWVKIIEPSIIPDTLYITEEVGTSYKVSGDTINLTPYLLKSDTTAMLVRYIERGDTASMLSNYPTVGEVNTQLGNYLPILGGTLTGTGGAGFIGFPSQVSAPGTPASGLNVYAQGSSFNWKGTDGFERQFASTLTGGRTYTLPDISGTFALGTGTADRLARWTGTNTQAAGNLSDNATRLQALLPWQFHSWTTAGRPSGVTGYTGYNTTGNGIEWYQGSRWAYGLESTFARGTATRIPFFDANGQVIDDASLFHTSSNGVLQVFKNLNGSTGFYSKNQSSGGSAIPAYVAENDAGKLMSFGISSSGYTAAPYIGHNTAFFYTDANNGFALSVNSNSNIRFSIGGIASTNEVLKLSSSGNDIDASRNKNAPLIFRMNNANAGTSVYSAITLIASTTSTRMFSIAKAGENTPVVRSISPGDSYLQSTYGDLLLFADVASGKIKFATNAASTPQMTLASTGNLLLGSTTDVSRTLHVSGEVRVTDLTTDTPTRIVGADSDGDLADITWLNPASNSLGIGVAPTEQLDVNGDVRIRDSLRITTTSSILQTDASGWVKPLTVGTGLSFSGGTLSATGGAGTARTIPYHNNSGVYTYNTSFKLDTTTTAGTLAKYKLNINNPSNLTGDGDAYQVLATYAGDAASTSGMFTVGDQAATMSTTGYGSVMQLYRTGGTFASKSNLSAGTNIGSFAWRGQVNGGSVALGNISLSYLGNGTTSRSSISIQTATSGGIQTGLSIDSVRTISLPAYGLGNKEASDLSKTQSSYIAGFATDGTILDYPISSLPNGIYSGSGTLSSHTTRAAIPSTGNLLFTQKYNSNADSAYIQVINNLDGNREVRLGLTDTVTTGYANLRLFQDEPNESMGFEFRTEDSYGGTTLKGENGGLSMYADNNLEMRGTEIRLNNGEVLMNQYGQGNMKSTDLGVSDSKYVAKFSTNGRVTDYYLARDTFIEDVTLFSVGTLMYDCQELTIVSSMTALASTYQEIRFPDAADHLRGKKIIVYSKKRDGGTYVPYISVVGGVSRLYYTTNPAVGGTDPSSQATLYIDDGTWSDHGTTYEFTCLKIDNTPSYRWVLKQR